MATNKNSPDYYGEGMFDSEPNAYKPTENPAQYYNAQPVRQTAQTASQTAAVQQPDAGRSPSASAGTGAGSMTTGAYDPNRNYAKEALDRINGLNGQFDPGIYSSVQDDVAGRNAKIAANADYYNSIGVSSKDTEGAAMQAYLDRYADAYKAWQENEARVASLPVDMSGVGGRVQNLQEQAAQSAQNQKLAPIDTSALKEYLSQWMSTARQQADLQADYAVQQGVNELRRTEEDARQQFQTQRNQIDIDEARARDNQALYAQTRGDRGGIGQAQYDAIAAAAATNRQTVNSAQTKLSTDIARQISDLRAQGEFQKADAALQLAQSYLSQLTQLEQWGMEANISIAQFNASVDQWAANYQAEMEQLGISVQQWTAELAEQMRQYDTSMAENQRQYDTSMTETQREFDQEMGLKLKQYAEAIRQFDANLALQIDELAEKIRANQVSESLAEKELQLKRDSLDEEHYQFLQTLTNNDYWKSKSYEQWLTERTDNQNLQAINTAMSMLQWTVEAGVMPSDEQISRVAELTGIPITKDTVKQVVAQNKAANDANIFRQIGGTSGAAAGTGTGLTSSMSLSDARSNLDESMIVSRESLITLFNNGYSPDFIKEKLSSPETREEDLRDPESGLQRKFDLIDRVYGEWTASASTSAGGETDSADGMTYANSGGGGKLNDDAFQNMRSQLTSLLRQGDDDGAAALIGNMAKFDLTDQQKSLIASTVTPYFSNFLTDNPYFAKNSTEGADSSPRKISSSSGVSITTNKDYHDISAGDPYDSNVSDSKKYSLSKEGDLGALKSDGTRSKYFTVREFASKDRKGSTDTVYVDPELVDVLDMIREHFGQPITINSGYRTWNHNITELGNKTEHSMHMYGRAADIVVKNTPIRDVYTYVNSILPGSAGGIGQYNKSGFVHVDVRSGSPWRTRAAN